MKKLAGNTFGSPGPWLIMNFPKCYCGCLSKEIFSWDMFGILTDWGIIHKNDFQNKKSKHTFSLLILPFVFAIIATDWIVSVLGMTNHMKAGLKTSSTSTLWHQRWIGTRREAHVMVKSSYIPLVWRWAFGFFVWVWIFLFATHISNFFPPVSS